MSIDTRLLSGIGVLAAVVEAGGFAKASEALGLTASGVSRAISRLEERVGARLFDRNARRTILTEAGRRLHADAVPLLAGIVEAADAVSESTLRVRGKLKLSVDPWFARIVMAPRLQAFLTKYPELDVELRITNAAEEILGGGVDAAVRFGPSVDSSMIVRKILETRVITVASPAYLSRRPPPLEPTDVARHDVILFRDPQSGRPFTWEFHKGETSLKVPVTSRLVLDDPSVALAVCEAGNGLFQSLEIGLEPWLQAGRLVMVLSDWAEERFPLYAYYTSRRQLTAKVRSFLDFVAG